MHLRTRQPRDFKALGILTDCHGDSSRNRAGHKRLRLPAKNDDYAFGHFVWVWQFVQHWGLKIHLSHDVIEAVDQQKRLLSVQYVPLIRTRHVTSKRVTTLCDIGNA
jgi:hypothetical protein